MELELRNAVDRNHQFFVFENSIVPEDQRKQEKEEKSGMFRMALHASSCRLYPTLEQELVESPRNVYSHSHVISCLLLFHQRHSQ